MNGVLEDAGKDRPTKALLLAGGNGTRLRPLTLHTPKCLIPIAGKPLLDYWFDALFAAGVRDVLINTHWLADQVREHIAGVMADGWFRIVESFEPELLGSAGTVVANRQWIKDGEQCLMVYADNLSSVNLLTLLDFHRSHNQPMTMMLFRASDPKRCGIVELDMDDRVVSFVEKPEAPKSDLANAGVYVLNDEAYREIAGMQAFDIGYDVLPVFVGRMCGWVADCYHRDIGTVQSLNVAEREAPEVFRAAETPLR